MNCWTTFAIAAKVCVEQTTLLGGDDNRRMVHQCATDSPEEHSPDFEFIVFSSPRPVILTKLESPIYPITLLITGRLYIYTLPPGIRM